MGGQIPDVAWHEYLNTLDTATRWAHCGTRTEHEEHTHRIAFNEAGQPETCPGTPRLPLAEADAEEQLPPEIIAATDRALEEITEQIDVERRLREFHERRKRSEAKAAGPDEYDEEYLRALRPGSQPLPTASDREGAHDALIREHLRESLAERRTLGLARYHTLLQAGNGRDSLRDAVEEVLDLAAYVQVWRQARDEALGLLSELRVALARYRSENVVPDIAAYAQPEDLIAMVRRVEHLLGGGTR